MNDMIIPIIAIATICLLVIIAVEAIDSFHERRYKAERRRYWKKWERQGLGSYNTFTSSTSHVSYVADHTAARRTKFNEQRRRVRVFEQHRINPPSDNDDPAEMHYHEWVRRSPSIVMQRDAMCRENGGGGYEWDLWVCHNTLCPAYAYVRVDQVEAVAQGWLDEVAPKPTVFPAAVDPDDLDIEPGGNVLTINPNTAYWTWAKS